MRPCFICRRSRQHASCSGSSCRRWRARCCCRGQRLQRSERCAARSEQRRSNACGDVSRGDCSSRDAATVTRQARGGAGHGARAPPRSRVRCNVARAARRNRLCSCGGRCVSKRGQEPLTRLRRLGRHRRAPAEQAEQRARSAQRASAPERRICPTKRGVCGGQRSSCRFRRAGARHCSAQRVPGLEAQQRAPQVLRMSRRVTLPCATTCCERHGRGGGALRGPRRARGEGEVAARGMPLCRVASSAAGGAKACVRPCAACAAAARCTPHVLLPLLQRLQRGSPGVVMRVGGAARRRSSSRKEQGSWCGRCSRVRDRGCHDCAQRGGVGSARCRARPHGEHEERCVGCCGRQRGQRSAESSCVCVCWRRRDQAVACQEGQLLRRQRRLRRPARERGAQRTPRCPQALAQTRHRLRRSVLRAQRRVKRGRRHGARRARASCLTRQQRRHAGRKGRIAFRAPHRRAACQLVLTSASAWRAGAAAAAARACACRYYS